MHINLGQGFPPSGCNSPPIHFVPYHVCVVLTGIPVKVLSTLFVLLNMLKLSLL